MPPSVEKLGVGCGRDFTSFIGSNDVGKGLSYRVETRINLMDLHGCHPMQNNCRSHSES